AGDDDRGIGRPLLRVLLQLLQADAEPTVGLGDAVLTVEVGGHGVGVVRDRVEQPGPDPDRPEVDEVEPAVSGGGVVGVVRHHPVLIGGGVGGTGTFGGHTRVEAGAVLLRSSALRPVPAVFGDGAGEHAVVDGVPGADVGVLDVVEALDPARGCSGDRAL